LLIFVFARRGVPPHFVILEFERELMVGDALLERDALPEDLAQGATRGMVGIELPDARTNEVVVMLAGELLAHIHRLVLQQGLILFQRRSPQVGTLSLRSNPIICESTTRCDGAFRRDAADRELDDSLHASPSSCPVTESAQGRVATR
jgi:hypothetical protein